MVRHWVLHTDTVCPMGQDVSCDLLAPPWSSLCSLALLPDVCGAVCFCLFVQQCLPWCSLVMWRGVVVIFLSWCWQGACACLCLS